MVLTHGYDNHRFKNKGPYQPELQSLQDLLTSTKTTCIKMDFDIVRLVGHEVNLHM